MQRNQGVDEQGAINAEEDTDASSLEGAWYWDGEEEDDDTTASGVAPEARCFAAPVSASVQTALLPVGASAETCFGT